MIVGLEKKLVGNIAGHNVYNIIQFDVIPFPKSTIHLSESQVMHLVCACLEDPVLFFALRVCNTYMLVCVWIFSPAVVQFVEVLCHVCLSLPT